MIKAKLGDLLQERGKSIYWLAREIGVTELALTNLKKGKTQAITFDMLDKICIALKCKPNDLLVHVDNEPNIGTNLTLKSREKKFAVK